MAREDTLFFGRSTVDAVVHLAIIPGQEGGMVLNGTPQSDDCVVEDMNAIAGETARRTRNFINCP